MESVCRSERWRISRAILWVKRFSGVPCGVRWWSGSLRICLEVMRVFGVYCEARW